MKLIHRIGYYLGGFSIGLVILFFFLGGKKVSCDYGPNARTVKNIGIKKRIYNDDVRATMLNHGLDTLAISDLIRTGTINFSESDARAEGCKTYILENDWDEKDVRMQIQNCDSTATDRKSVCRERGCR